MLAVIAAIIRSLSLSFTRRPHFDAGDKNSFPLRCEIFTAPPAGRLPGLYQNVAA